MGSGTPRKFHGQTPRGLDLVPRSRSYEGRFGRMFRHLPPLESGVEDLVKLGQSMIDPNRKESDKPDDPLNNADVPAGYTYLGQFVDHDLTFDPVSSFVRQSDPDARENFRTPRFDLDSLYGDGPADSPFMYETDGATLLIGRNEACEEDLPRSGGRAIIGDPRNDENLIVSQLHLAFMKYHNRVVKELGQGPDVFAEARRIVRRHYHWIVLRDFLPRIVGEDVVRDILKKDDYLVSSVSGTGPFVWRADLKFFHWVRQPFIPVEFAAAAYRFGHSMVRTDYALQTITDDEVDLFEPEKNDGDQPNDLRGFRSRPPGRTIDWARFFKFPGVEPREKLPQLARAFDTHLAHALGGLPPVVGPQTGAPPGVNPADLASLAVRNLLRGRQLGLPSGEDVARAMGIPPISILGDGQGETPLWYYVLREAEVFCEGRRLGPVGGRIVAEVFIGLMHGDASSFLRAEPAWQPHKVEYGATEDGEFGITDLLKYAGVSIYRESPTPHTAVSN